MLAALVSLAACGGAGTEPVEHTSIWSGSVQVAASASGLVVHNDTEAPIAYFVVDAADAPLVDWAPCADTSASCLRLAPGGPHLVPASRIVGYTDATREVIFYWWHVVSATDGKMRPDVVRSTHVRLGE
jgi:hypothetical protein